jgi:hypothetical protein
MRDKENTIMLMRDKENTVNNIRKIVINCWIILIKYFKD